VLCTLFCANGVVHPFLCEDRRPISKRYIWIEGEALLVLDFATVMLPDWSVANGQGWACVVV